MKNDGLGIALLFSLAIHIFLLLIGPAIFDSTRSQRPDYLSIEVVDFPLSEPQPPAKAIATPEAKKPAPPPVKEDATASSAKPKVTPPPPPDPPETADPPQPAPAVPSAVVPKEEPVKDLEAPAQITPPLPAVTPNLPPDARGEGGGSEAGAGNLFDKGDVGVVPGPGTAGGGSGTGSSGLGRGSGAPGLPTATTPIRTNRQAKPIQTVKASYPPMALRAGLESDVTLKIEVDAEGKVTRAEVTKSGGTAFDEEALKAVRQARFEPAQRDGQAVPAEFIYVYRFRLRR